MPSPRSRAFAGQLLRFGAVGGVGFVVDVVLFTLLSTTVLAPTVVASGPLWAKVASTSVAIVVNWVGNRLWAFRDGRQRNTAREGLEFAAVSVAGMGFGVASIWVSRYVLGFESVLADNIAGNGVGLALGAIFRFALYRWWVFAPHRSRAAAAPAASSSAAAAAAAAASSRVHGEPESARPTVGSRAKDGFSAPESVETAGPN